MLSKKIVIKIPTGLEARPVALLVQVASQYESNVYVECEEKKINAKSIMGMMSLGLPAGEEINVIVDGVDEEVAMLNIEKYLCGE
ncbi:HPr family phosphocarrier protein [Clostridium sp. Marseille-P299]|uniref:HPr family phosphocarrier protein n=1 Tax=Clostridium sp. Marseille-P299 TaxID=1805477 RepID=UPI0008356BC6|nr:HPr family phosphocarrier protein [Clostridium sp. Marseille-P299]